MSSEVVVEVRELTRRYGEKVALSGIDFTAGCGSVVGIVGENGAGKTTLIKHLLGLLKAQSGTVRVFGLDPVAQPERVLGRIGYLSEEPELPPWMTVAELMSYTRAFHSGWDQAYADELIDAFGIDRHRKTKTLSKGQRARVGLVAAQAHRPDLLLLDEPSSGLDPIVRRDILAAIIRSVGREGRSVVFSSHLLNEVEAVCDRVVMISRGRVVLSDELEEIRRGHHRLTFASSEAKPELPGLLQTKHEDGGWVAIVEGEAAEVVARARAAGLELGERATPSLEEIFVARSGVDPLAGREEESSKPSA